ncbi:MAG: IS630 family transposase [Gemmataceae bacterium]
MALILPKPSFFVKERFVERFRKCRQALVRVRYLIILNVWSGRSAREIERVLKVHNTTVYRVVRRFREHDEASLWDGREDNGAEKLSEHFLAILDRVVRSNPQEHGWRRPTWTRETLVETMVRKTGVRIHVATMSRALGLIRARRANPRPRVRCPWFPAVKTRRINALRRLIATLPPREVAVYEDEVDIHLNPKIGLDWMGLGQQKDAITPGQNEKRYLAGALDVRSGQVHWVEAEQKNSWLFWDLLYKLTRVYAEAKIIHVILDNYGIHSSKIIAVALANFASRIRLHFLPPFSPDDNAIERIWQDLHANVTRNHRCASMAELLGEVRYYLRKRNRRTLRQTATATAA